MDILDRYLQAVKKHLPWKRQDDILAELRANLESQLEEKEEALGRPLTAAEAEAWLKEIGPPMEVAARYQPQQYLIGPALFPTYWFVLGRVLAWAIVVSLILSAFQIFAQAVPSGISVLEALLRLPGVLITAAAWVTLVFAGLEFIATHYPEKYPAISGHFADWSPKTLPAVDEVFIPGAKRRSYAHAVADFVVGILFLLWLLLIPHYPVVVLGPGVVYLSTWRFALAPVWEPFYWSVIALSVLQIALHGWDLLRRTWDRPHPVRQVLIKTVGVVPALILLTASDHVYLTLKNPALDAARYGVTVQTINPVIYRCTLLGAAVVGLQLAWMVVQMVLEAYRRRAAVQG